MSKKKEKMTIHRGLAELKHIDKRIEKKVVNLNVVNHKREGHLISNIYQEDEYKKNAKSDYQSIVDLIKRKDNIKRSIVKANAEHFVTVGGTEMTIADAITQKDSMELKKSLLEHLEHQYKLILGEVNKGNEKVEQTALLNAQKMLETSGEKKDTPDDESVKQIMEPFIARHKFHLVDPLDIEKLIKKLSDEIDAFETEVDSVLSEANAVTFIEV